MRAIVKVAYIAAVDDYIRVEELPSARGFADIAYIPKPGSSFPPLLVELKWNRTAEGAIRQIHDRNYPAVFHNMHKDVLLVGINYDEKSKSHQCQIEQVMVD